ncbi:uncharacterized protein EV154DRAFT_540013 [Mucor mucedo]|uniref:uncharacterized protein n=1 Tax=Mucor mucedo TaxID=29922 RepID=UPI00222034B7|nr:uncharacterized protein EV154DRAFT_540013 [Mucor mucedo]KAI7881727.1 hypothetical protein EV154DRAFT_540013 [Mucor mucedo]
MLLYSEEDFKLKFWGHIFEELFSTSNVCLHWGDTVPFIFKYTEASPKVDLRIISTMSCKEGGHSLCEFSKVAETTRSYQDKLKLTLMAKHHVNSLIDNYNIHSHYPLEFVEGIGYVMKQLDRCCFPIAKKSVDEGGIETLIKCISNVKVN